MSSSDQHIYGEPVQDQMLLKPNKPNLTELGPAQPPLVLIPNADDISNIFSDNFRDALISSLRSILTVSVWT